MKDITEIKDKYVSAAELADLLQQSGLDSNIDERRVKGWAKNGYIPCIKLGERLTRYSPEAVFEHIEKNCSVMARTATNLKRGRHSR